MFVLAILQFEEKWKNVAPRAPTTMTLVRSGSLYEHGDDYVYTVDRIN